MSLTERIEEWRRPENWDAEPTEEMVLRMFLFSAIHAFLEEHEADVRQWLNGSGVEVPGLNEWVDEYGDRPLSQPDGYARPAGRRVTETFTDFNRGDGPLAPGARPHTL